MALKQGQKLSFFISQIAVLCVVFSVEFFFRHVFYQRVHMAYPSGQVKFSRAGMGIGLEGAATFTATKQGFRGTSLLTSTKSILVLGSSGTLGWLLSDEESWPVILQQKANSDSLDYKVATAARLGNRMVENHLQLKKLLEEGMRPSHVLVVGSGVELQIKLYQGVYFKPNYLRTEEEKSQAYKRAFAVVNGPFNLTKWAFWHWLHHRNDSLSGQVKPPEDYFTKARNQRQQAKIFSELPPLDDVLSEMSHHQKEISRLAVKHGFKLSFLSRPVLFKNEMSASEEKLLWVGYKGDYRNQFPSSEKQHSEYYSSRVLKEAFEQYRSVLKKNSEEDGVKFIDVASVVPQNEKYFFDGTHLKPIGSEVVAEFVFNNIKSDL